MNKIILLLALCGCGGCYNDFPDLPYMPLKTVVIGTDAEKEALGSDWDYWFKQAVVNWNNNLNDNGCGSAFFVDNSAVISHQVRLIPSEYWDEGQFDHNPKSNGVTFDGPAGSDTSYSTGYIDIEFRPLPGTQAVDDNPDGRDGLDGFSGLSGWGRLIEVATHELGHSLGLWHVDQSDNSIMTPSPVGVLVPTQEDMYNIKYNTDFGKAHCQ